MDLLELIAGVQEDVENAPVETARMELVFDRFFRLTGLDIGLQTKILADALSGELENARHWCDGVSCSLARIELYDWLHRNWTPSLTHDDVVNKLLDCLRRNPRSNVISGVRHVIEAHQNYIRKCAMQMHTDLTPAGFWRDAGEAMQVLLRNALSIAVRREEEEREDDRVDMLANGDIPF